jgi:propanol-preferring alcohol dehydrogenase
MDFDRQMPIEAGPLELAEILTPHPRAHEIRVKVSVCGICWTDLHIAEGDLPLKTATLVLGHEIVGVVDEVGEQATKYSKGDRVGISWLGGTAATANSAARGAKITVLTSVPRAGM